MKYMKYLLGLTIALFAIASASTAQTVQFLGGGSSAMFLELGQAAQSAPATSTPCVWTQGKTASVVARDSRTGNVDEQGNIWVTWGPGTGTCAAPIAPFNIYSYMSVDSVVGDKCYFEVDASNIPGCVQIMTIAANTAGKNQLCSPSAANCTNYGPDTPIPQAVITALNNKHWFVIGTDIRPEDAKFAAQRMFVTCDSPFQRESYNQTLYQTYGLGYQTATNGLGVPVQSSFSAAVSNTLNFNIAGNDPITNNAVPGYSVVTVGAQPIVVVVSPVPAVNNTGIGAATDINGFTLTLFMQGVLGRSTDLFGPTSTNPVTTLIREPLSGTYNTMEYSIPNSSQFKASQDYGNCNGATFNSNPFNLASANGQVPGASRKRVIGTGEMVSTLQAANTDTLGYFFWSAGNAANFTATNGKYLTVNGVDPLQNSYAGGVLPNATNGNLANVTFKWLNQGDYPIWSALRLVSTSPTPAGVTNVVAAAQTLNSTQFDFIPLSKLNVWHSHFYLPAINQGIQANGTTINPATPGDLCSAAGALTEVGGDVGGTNVLKQANADFCSDFGNQNGLINKNN